MESAILLNSGMAASKQAILGIYAHCAIIAQGQIESASAANIEQAILSLKAYLCSNNLPPNAAAQWLKAQAKGRAYIIAQYAGQALSQWQQGKGCQYFKGIA